MSKRIKLIDFVILCSVLVAVALPGTVRAAVKTWVGTTSGDWADGGNWLEGAAPQPGDDVVVDGGYINVLNISLSTGSVTINSLDIGASAVSEVVVVNAAVTAGLWTVTSDVRVGGLGTLTHAGPSSAEAGGFVLDVGGDFTLDVGGIIDVSGRGLAGGAAGSGGTGPGGGIIGTTSSAGGGGGHGGMGGKGTPLGEVSAGGVGYGSLAAPIALGSGGAGGSSYGGGAGGGAVKLLVSGVFALDGVVRANGGDAELVASTGDGGGGAGGSIWVDAGTLTGAGALQANGGEGRNGGGGAGGRIALEFDSSTYAGLWIASGGTAGTGSTAGAGTVYTKLRGAPYGGLLIDNGGPVGEGTAMLEDHTLASLTLRDGASWVVRDGSHVTLPDATFITSGEVGVLIEARGLWSSDGLAELQNISLDNYGVLTLPGLTSLTACTLTNHGTLNLPAIASFAESVVTNHAVYNHSGSTLHIGVGATWYENGSLPGLGDTQVVTDFLVDGTLEFWNQSANSGAAFDSLTVNSAGVVSHRANGQTETSILHLLLGNLEVATGGKIDVDGRGFAGGDSGQNGFGPGASAGAVQMMAGGSTYGGEGGHGVLGGGGVDGWGGLPMYGDAEAPDRLGSGGGGGKMGMNVAGTAGGGAIKLIVSGVALIDGRVSASGASGDRYDSSGGGGSGGSVWIDAVSFAGDGRILAMGSDGGNIFGMGTSGAGGGGRVALYSSIAGFRGDVFADGGNSFDFQSMGRAGTEFIHGRNQPPGPPDMLGPTGLTNGGYSPIAQPVLEFRQVDQEVDDRVRFDIQVDDTADFSSPVVVYVSEYLAQGVATFTVGQIAGNGAYTVGVAEQTLPPGVYYWRVRSTDLNDNISGFSDANAGGPAFIVNDPPSVMIMSPIADSIHDSVAVVSGQAADADGAIDGVDVTLYSVTQSKFYNGSSFVSETAVWLPTISSDFYAQWALNTDGILESGNDYLAEPRVVDALGQVVVGDAVSFSLLAVDDCVAQNNCLSLEVESGNGQSAVVGTALSLPLVVRVVDTSGSAVAGTSISWQAVSPGALVEPSESISDSAGHAQATATLGPNAGIGSDLFSALPTGYPTATAVFVATAYDAAPLDITGMAAVIRLEQTNPTGTVLVSLDGADSTPSDGASMLDYLWDFGDGRVASGGESMLSEISYSLPGTYGVGLEIRDSFGEKARAKEYLIIRDGSSVPPVARIMWEIIDPITLEVGFSCDCTDEDGEIVASLWEYGDGDKTELADQHHLFAEPGTYRVRLSVEDNSGLVAHDQAFVVLARGGQLPPTARIQSSVLEGPAPLSVTFGAEVYDDDGSIVATSWELLGESLEDVHDFTRVFSEPGYYSVRLQAWDNDGLAANDQATVIVRSGKLKPPRIVSVANVSATVGTAYRYDADGLPSVQGSRPLLWSLKVQRDGVMVPADASIAVDSNTGEFQWTPIAAQVGEHRFRLEVKNTAGVAIEDFAVQVADAVPDEVLQEPAGKSSTGCRQASPSSALCLLIMPWYMRRRAKRHALRDYGTEAGS